MTNPIHKRIVLLESDCLLYAGMKSFLTDQEHLDVIGINIKDPEGIYQAILKIQPDVIILNQNDQQTNLTELMDWLRNLPSVRTIAVNVTDNQIQIWEQKQILIQELGDFLDVL
jgi:DNA-binding NarL/FixJ family response regulator